MGDEKNRTSLRGRHPLERWFWTILALVIIAAVIIALTFL